MPEEMIVADSQEELDKIPCPRCEQCTLKMTSVRYSCPLQFIAHCTNCVFREHAEGLPIKVLEGEEAVRKRPQLYLDHENPAWQKLAKEVLAAQIPVGSYCYDIKEITDNGTIKTIPCPFWELRKDKPEQENGYCHFLKSGDWESEGFSLLWDGVKECGINDDLAAGENDD